jgi:hypothetical protein
MMDLQPGSSFYQITPAVTGSNHTSPMSLHRSNGLPAFSHPFVLSSCSPEESVEMIAMPMDVQSSEMSMNTPSIHYEDIYDNPIDASSSFYSHSSHGNSPGLVAHGMVMPHPPHVVITSPYPHQQNLLQSAPPPFPTPFANVPNYHTNGGGIAYGDSPDSSSEVSTLTPQSYQVHPHLPPMCPSMYHTMSMSAPIATASSFMHPVVRVVYFV